MKFVQVYFVLSIFLPYLICAKESQETLEQVFARTRRDVLENGRLQIDGYLFSVGWSELKTNSSVALKISTSKAKHNAFLGFIYFYDLSDNLKKIEEPLRTNIIEHYTDLASPGGYVKKSVEVERGTLNGNVYSVVACPVKDNNHLIRKLALADILKMYEKMHNKNDSRLKLSLYIEIAPEVSLGRLLKALAEKYDKDVGSKQYQLMFAGEKCHKIDAEVYLNSSKIDLEQLTVNDCLMLLGAAPYQPELCKALSVKLKTRGYNVNGQVFLHLSRLHEMKQQKSNDFLPSLPLLIKDARLAVTGELITAKGMEKFKNAQLIISCYGELPLREGLIASNEHKKGNSLFFSNPPKIDEALAVYLSALEEEISADTCNMIGACLREKGLNETALVFFNQACNLDSKHKYAFINLAKMLKMVGRPEAAATHALYAKRHCNLDSWGIEELRKILGNKAY